MFSFALLLVVLFILAAYWGFSAAVMDTVDFKFYKSVFYQPYNKKHIFGYVWNVWWNQLEGWKNKYVNRDPLKEIRSTYLLGIKTPDWFTEIISDAWHFFKAQGILAVLLIGIVSSVIGHSFTASEWYWYLPLHFILILSTYHFSFEYFLTKLLRK